MKYLIIPILILQVIFWFVLHTDNVSINGDNGRYLALGTSIAQGTGYHAIDEYGSPREKQYPAGFPVLIAGTIKIFGSLKIEIVKYMLLIMALLSTFLLWKMHRFTGFLVGLSFHAAVWSNICMSEIPYMFSWILAYYYLREGKNQWILLFLSLLPPTMRSIGITYAIYYVVICIVEKRYKWGLLYIILLVAFYVSPYSGMTAYLNNHYNVQSLDSVGSSVPWIVTIAATFFRYLWYHITAGIGRIIFPLFPKFIIFGIVMALLIIVGMIKSLIAGDKKEKYLLIFFILSMGAIMQWSTEIGIRLMVPYFPLIVYYIVRSFSAKKRIYVALLVLLLQVDSVLGCNRGPDQQWKDFFAISKMCAELPQNSVIMSRKMSLTWYYSGHQCIPYPSDINNVEEMLKIADYVIITNFPWDKQTALFEYFKLPENKNFEIPMKYQVNGVMVIDVRNWGKK